MPSHCRTDALQWLANEYHDLNGFYVEILEKPPTALEFSRMIHVSRPAVIKGVNMPALNKWTDGYLINKMDGRKISVAITPNGLADAITEGSDGRFYFAEPYVCQMTMSELLSRLGTGQARADTEVCYLQSQNGNLYTSKYFEVQDDSSELEPLREDVPSEMAWSSEALDKHPDAVNLWIGDGKSSTSIHSDPYENIYTVIRGAKHFTLLPPTEGQYLDEKWYPHARYTRSADSRLRLTTSEGAPPVRWSSISDPHLPGALSTGAHPIHVSLLPGETLYLPAGWWHHVRQAAETTIAVNWWYDVEMRGMSWVMLSFLRTFGSPAKDKDEDASADSVTVTR